MKAGLFVTCIIDVARPQVGVAAVKLMRAAGVDVVCPPGQTCCGQIAWNGGYRRLAADIAARCAGTFADCDRVVIPSGSCCGFFRVHCPDLVGKSDRAA